MAVMVNCEQDLDVGWEAGKVDGCLDAGSFVGCLLSTVMAIFILRRTREPMTNTLLSLRMKLREVIDTVTW